MTEQSARAFAERFTSDEAFRERLAAAPDQEARGAIAREEGYDIGPEDGPALKAAFGADDLSDEDLERISGALDGIADGTLTFGCIRTYTAYCVVTSSCDP